MYDKIIQLNKDIISHINLSYGRIIRRKNNLQ